MLGLAVQQSAGIATEDTDHKITVQQVLHVMCDYVGTRRVKFRSSLRLSVV